MNRTWPHGIVDTHVHSSPDVVPRLMSDVEIARAADEADYRAVVLKSHHTVTAARASFAEDHTDETRMFGGVALNLHATGGINRYAVDTALKLGAKVIWLPTFTSANQVRFAREEGLLSEGLKALGTIEGDGISVLDDSGRITDELGAVLDLIAAAGATLATGHISPRETMVVVPEAKRRGVANILITHPELMCVGLPVEQQLVLAEHEGVWFERVYGVTSPGSENYPIADLAQAVRTVGIDSTVMATDYGQMRNPSPVTGMTQYIDAMLDQDFSKDDIELMTCANPAAALGLSVQ